MLYVFGNEVKKLAYGNKFDVFVQLLDESCDIIHRSYRPGVRDKDGIALDRRRVGFIIIDSLCDALGKAVISVAIVVAGYSPQSFSRTYDGFTVRPI